MKSIILALVAGAVICQSAGAWPSVPPLPGAEHEPDSQSVVQVGVRAMSGNRESSKFEEYRDYRPGVFANANVHEESRDRMRFLDLIAVNPGYNDTRAGITYGKYGEYEFSLLFDEIPHDFSNTARTIFVSPTPGVLVLPPGLQAFIADGGVTATQSARLKAALATAPRVPLEFKTSDYGYTNKYRINDRWSVDSAYTRLHKEGTKPMGITFGTPGNNFVDFAAPVDQDIDDFRTSMQVHGHEWNAALSYWGSVFSNNIDTLVVDNPLAATDTAGAGTRRGRFDNDPSNDSHTISLTGSKKYEIGFPARLTGTVSFGRRRQNDFFIPHTINSAIASPLLALPAQSLNGQSDTSLANLSFTGRPTKDTNFTLKYRYYDLESDTPRLDFPGHVIGDRSLTAEDRLPEPTQYRKENYSADGTWRINDPLALRVGYEHENFNRPEHREVRQTSENTYKAGLDWRPKRGEKWVVRTDYSFATRTDSNYDPLAHFHKVLEEDALDTVVEQLQLQSPLLRKFDLANRRQNKAQTYVTFNPNERWQLGVTGSYALSDYDSSPMGLQSDERFSFGYDSSWQINDRMKWSGWYTYENIHARQLSRFRTLTGTGAATVLFDSPLNNWGSTSTDRVNTIGGAFDYVITPGKWDAQLSWVDQVARGATVSDSTPGAAVPAGTADGGLAYNFPELRDELITLSMLLRRHFSKSFSLDFEYRYEHFSEVNYKYDGLQPFNPFSNVGQNLVITPSTDVFLGDQINNYNVHVFALSAQQRF